MFFHRTKLRLSPYIVLGILALWLGVGLYLYHWWQSNGIVGVFQSAEDKIEEKLGMDVDMFFALAPHVLGFRHPQTILLLFQNNTELRPGGGFIGSYATVRMERGKSEVLAIEGSENLDWRAPDEWRVEPPAPIKKYLALDRWYFRDSNWSPDWASSARRILQFYQAEGGVAGEDVGMVIAMTPTVLEELLRLTGPVTVDGISFGAEDVTEKLEYEVEIGYRERGIPKEDRKAIIGRLMQAIFARASALAFTNLTKRIELANRLVAEKQILAYATEAHVQALLDKHGLSGRVQDVHADYLMWVDANLGALKTDHAIVRSLQYKIAPQAESHELEVAGYIASVTMKYNHRGAFDWRTTRYLDYARLYVPIGAELTSVVVTGKKGRVLSAKEADLGQELGKQWFGAFITVEPGETVEAQFIYRLPNTISDQIKEGLYTLFVQKQPGTIANGLTLDLDFGTPIKAVMHGDVVEEWAKAVYTLELNLREDRKFSVFL